MHHRRRFFLVFAVASTLLLSLSPTAASLSPSTSNVSYPNCFKTFSCGPLRNVSYPFTGGDRPAYYGPPELRLSCSGGDSPELTFDSLTYRVLQLNQTSRSLTLSRSDLDNNTCLQQYTNTTLNSTIFSYSPNDQDLTLFYGCMTLLTIQPQNLFICQINGTYTDNYYLMGPIPSSPILNVSRCNVSLAVPISQSAVDLLTADHSKLGEALMEGFEVGYSNPYDDQCSQCAAFGAECGYDIALGRPICICGGGQLCFPSTGSSSLCTQLE